MLLVERQDEDEPILGVERAVQAVGRRRPIMLLELFRESVKDGVEHGDVDVLPLTRPLPVEQRPIDRAQGLQGGRRVGDGRTHVERAFEARLVLQIDLLETALGLHHRGVGRTLRAGPRLPVAGNRAHDDSRVGLRQRRVVKPQTRHDPGAEIFHHHVIDAHQLSDDVSRGGALEVEGQAFLAAVELAVHGADALTHGRHVAGEFPSRRLDFQYLRPQIGHQAGAVRTGDDRGEIQDANAVQYPRSGVLPVGFHDGSVCLYVNRRRSGISDDAPLIRPAR